MLEYICSKEEHRFFTNWEHILAFMGLSRDMLVRGVHKRSSLSSLSSVSALDSADRHSESLC